MQIDKILIIESPLHLWRLIRAKEEIIDQSPDDVFFILNLQLLENLHTFPILPLSHIIFERGRYCEFARPFINYDFFSPLYTILSMIRVIPFPPIIILAYTRSGFHKTTKPTLGLFHEVIANSIVINFRIRRNLFLSIAQKGIRHPLEFLHQSGRVREDKTNHSHLRSAHNKITPSARYENVNHDEDNRNHSEDIDNARSKLRQE